MLVSVKWLSDYVPMSSMPMKQLAERLTVAGVKIERTISQGDDWENVTVARVLSVEPHPNADRLRLVTVDIAGEEQPTVVCGAPNVAEGQKVAYAPIGTRLRDGHSGEWAVLKAARIRGVESTGMVCSEKELGLSDSHEGILVLPEDAEVGQPLKEYMGDTIFDIEVTPNRPDHMSVLGVAWEVAAQTHARVREPERLYNETGSSTASQRTAVLIEDRDLCPRYVAGIVERVKIGPSPEWMQERLISAGMRPINNVVDITNYVMLEMGQPLHAFDYRRLGGQRIVVRRAREGEVMRTLDDVDRELTPDMLVIADANKPVAIAGVMGGADAEVGPNTTTILLEAANFDPVNIRRTSQALGLRTEASVRFEKGLHPELAAMAARRAIKLLIEVAGGRAAKGLVDVYPNKRADTRVVVTRQRVEQVLGMDLSTTAVRSALTDLGFGCRWVPPDRYVVRAPYWRTDVNIADDVAEELARVIGYDRLDALALAGAVPTPSPDPVRELREHLRDAAVAAGVQEIITYPLTTPEVLLRVASPDSLEVYPPLRLENPMSNELAVVRPSLRASVLQVLGGNLKRERGTVALFEAGRAFLTRANDLPDEREMIVGGLAGVRLGRWGEPTSEAVDFYDAKGLLQEMIERVGAEVRFEAAEEFGMLPGHVANLTSGGETVGMIGQVHPQVASSFEIDGPAFIFEVDVEKLLPAVHSMARHRAPSRYPAVIQDLALLVDDSVPAARVTEVIASSSLVAEARLFDVYEGPPLPQGKRSLAFAVQFQSSEKTLTDTEVADARNRIVRRLQHELGAELRGG